MNINVRNKHSEIYFFVEKKSLLYLLQQVPKATLERNIVYNLGTS